MLLSSLLGSILTANNSVQDASALHLGFILTANTSVQDTSASALTSGLHPRCQIHQFMMLLPSLLGSILTAKYISSGCFCHPSGLHPHCQISQFRMLLSSIWAPSSLPNTSVQDASALISVLHPRCQIPQFRMLLTSLLGSILTAKYIRMLLLSIWAPSSLPNTSDQDASALHLGSILTAKYLIPGCFCPPSGLHHHCQIPQSRMLLLSLLCSILAAKYLSSVLPSIWAPSSLPKTSVPDASALTSLLHPHCRNC